MEQTQPIADQRISLHTLAALAIPGRTCPLSQDPAFVDIINSGAQFLADLWQKQGLIYGVTTGFGDSCDVSVTDELCEQMPENLYAFHGCGTGRMLSEYQARMVLLVRLVSLCQGVSGVRYALLEQLANLLNHGVIPLIPEEGSVGASGDLTPLSYVAAVISGQRQVYFKGEVVDTEEAFAATGIQPLKLKPKEGLAIMNGTAVMTALAIEAFQRSSYLAHLCSRITALATVALGSNPKHFDEFLFSVKPHQGQQQVAAWIRGDVDGCSQLFDSGRLQERYSIRCAPHVIGVLMDILPWYEKTIEDELNSANDNPIIDAESETIHHGGHFYGGHIAFAMDGMKNNVANLADLLDRQMALMVDVKFNHGLPRNLSGAPDSLRPINHGFKAVQIACSAWAAEALKLTMPASVFSRSTESHNQDKVSMGTIAARDCLRVLQLTEQTAAAALIATVQAIGLRIRQNELTEAGLSEGLRETVQSVQARVPMVNEDRQLDGSIQDVVQHIQKQSWKLYG